MNNKYSTLSQTVNALKEQGYTINYQFKDNKMVHPKSGKTYDKEQLTIVEQYRFEGMSNPSDMSILFAVEAKDGSKGVITSAFGPYGNAELLSWMDDLEVVGDLTSTG